MESVVALFPEHRQAQTALQALVSRGFEREHLGFAVNDPVAENDMAQATGVSPEAGAPAGAAGTINGALLGLVAGLVLTGVVWLILLLMHLPSNFSIGGLYGMLFGGIGGLTLGGMFGALGGSDHGDYVGLLRRMGVPAPQAEKFYGGIKNGYVMVIARDASGARADEALSILRRSGAVSLEDAVGGGALQSERSGHNGH